MMKHNDKMVDTRDYPITRGTLEHFALQASWRTAQRSEAYRQRRRKQIISAAKYAGYTLVLVAFAAVVVGLVAIVLGVR